jgi:hypothetical protein
MVAFTVMGQKMEQTDSATLHLTTTVGDKDDKGRTAVMLKVNRIQASVAGLTSNASIDTDTFDQTKPLPAHEFVPNIALMRQPIQLLFEPNGRLVGIAGTDMLVAEIDNLLKKDFAGSQEIEFSGPTYLANAREPAMRALWNDAVINELPKDFKLGEEWEKTEEWPLEPFEMTTKTKSVAEDAGAHALRIQSKIEVPSSQPKTVKLGPIDWTYSILNGSGRDTTILDEDGWVRQSDTELEINYNGSLGIGGQSIPFDMNIKLKFRMERLEQQK